MSEFRIMTSISRIIHFSILCSAVLIMSLSPAMMGEVQEKKEDTNPADMPRDIFKGILVGISFDRQRRNNSVNSEVVLHFFIEHAYTNTTTHFKARPGNLVALRTTLTLPLEQITPESYTTIVESILPENIYLGSMCLVDVNLQKRLSDDDDLADHIMPYSVELEKEHIQKHLIYIRKDELQGNQVYGRVLVGLIRNWSRNVERIEFELKQLPPDFDDKGYIQDLQDRIARAEQDSIDTCQNSLDKAKLALEKFANRLMYATDDEERSHIELLIFDTQEYLSACEEYCAKLKKDYSDSE